MYRCMFYNIISHNIFVLYYVLFAYNSHSLVLFVSSLILSLGKVVLFRLQIYEKKSFLYP